jgi:hypothetical protein
MENIRDAPGFDRFGLQIVLVVSAALGIGGCERAPESSTPPPAVADTSPLDFSPQVQCADAAVNQFVRHVAEVCAGGDYEQFRLLWSVREDPYPRQEFERGWKALRKVRVLSLEKMKTREGQYLYALHAQVELDPAMPEPTRQVVLLIVQENDRWRLAKAPAHLRQKTLGHAKEGNGNANTPDDYPGPEASSSG